MSSDRSVGESWSPNPGQRPRTVRPNLPYASTPPDFLNRPGLPAPSTLPTPAPNLLQNPQPLSTPQLPTLSNPRLTPARSPTPPPDPQDPESTGSGVTCGEAVRLARRSDAQGQALGLGGLRGSPPPPPPQQHCRQHRRRRSLEEGRGPDRLLGKPDTRGLRSRREPGHAQTAAGAKTALGGRRSQQSLGDAPIGSAPTGIAPPRRPSNARS